MPILRTLSRGPWHGYAGLRGSGIRDTLKGRVRAVLGRKRETNAIGHTWPHPAQDLGGGVELDTFGAGQARHVRRWACPPLRKLPAALRVPNDEFGFAVHRQDLRRSRVLQAGHVGFGMRPRRIAAPGMIGLAATRPLRRRRNSLGRACDPAGMGHIATRNSHWMTGPARRLSPASISRRCTPMALRHERTPRGDRHQARLGR